MTHTQIIESLVLALLVSTSATLNGLYFHSLGGWLLVPVGLSIQGLAMLTAADLSTASDVRRWIGSMILFACLGVSAYSASGVLTLKGESRETPAIQQLTQSIESIDQQLLNLTAKGVVTAAKPLRQTREELIQELSQERQPNQEFALVAVMLGILIDLGAAFLVSGQQEALQASPEPQRGTLQTRNDPTPPKPRKAATKPIEIPTQLSLIGGTEGPQGTMEAQVLALIARGVTQRVIAKELGISQSSVSRIKKAA